MRSASVLRERERSEILTKESEKREREIGFEDFLSKGVKLLKW